MSRLRESMKPINVISTLIQKERKRVGLSLSTLAKNSNIAKSTLSQLESGSGNPSIETLWALANSLNIPVSRLIEDQKPPIKHIKAGQGVKTASEQTNYVATLLSISPPNTRRDIYSLIVQPDEMKLSTPHPNGTIEHIIMMKGKAIAGPIDHPVELNEGDYLSYPADIAHTFKALKKDTNAILIIENK